MNTGSPPGNVQRGSNNTILLLSLKLILLAFFILLNSLAEFEVDRTRAVIDSVHQAFDGKIDSAERPPSYSEALGALPEAEAKIDEIGSLFAAIVPEARATRSWRAQAYRVDVPAGALFRPATPLLLPGREALVRGLAEILARDDSTAAPLDLEILVGTAGATADALSGIGPASLEVPRAAALAQELIAEGLAASALTIGLLPDYGETVRFVFRLPRTETPHPGPPSDVE